MPSDPQKIVTLAAMAAVFGLVLSVWFAGLLIWSARRVARNKKMEKRLGLTQEAEGPSRVLRLWHDGKEATTTVPGAAAGSALLAKLEKLRRDAGWETPARSILMGLAAMSTLVFAFTLLTSGNLLVALLAPLAAMMVFWVFVSRRVSRRGAMFERQLVDALDLASRSLRAGHPLVGAFRLISEEIPAPIGNLFAEVCQQQNMGMGLDEALREACTASPSQDMKLFGTSVIIQLKGGGNLADMMERLAFVLRERMRLARRVRVLTAQTQFSKNTLLALPFIVFVLLNVLNPEYMMPLYTTPSGKLILIIAAVGLFIGAFIMNRLATLKT